MGNSGSVLPVFILFVEVVAAAVAGWRRCAVAWRVLGGFVVAAGLMGALALTFSAGLLRVGAVASWWLSVGAAVVVLVGFVSWVKSGGDAWSSWAQFWTVSIAGGLVFFLFGFGLVSKHGVLVVAGDGGWVVGGGGLAVVVLLTIFIGGCVARKSFKFWRN